MSQYKITSDELSNLARDIYEEACGGYLDLKESICDKIIRDFVKRLTPVIPAAQTESSNNEYAGPENNPASWTYGTTTVGTIASSHGWIPVTSAASNVVFTVGGGGGSWVSGGAGGNGAVVIQEMRDEVGVSLRPQEYLRPENYLETNSGNESERF